MSVVPNASGQEEGWNEIFGMRAASNRGQAASQDANDLGFELSNHRIAILEEVRHIESIKATDADI